MEAEEAGVAVERRQARKELGAARGTVQQGDAVEVRTLRREGLDQALPGAAVHDARGGAGGREREDTQVVHDARVVDAGALGVQGALRVHTGLWRRAVV